MKIIKQCLCILALSLELFPKVYSSGIFVAQHDLCDELLGFLLPHQAEYAYKYESLTYFNVFGSFSNL